MRKISFFPAEIAAVCLMMVSLGIHAVTPANYCQTDLIHHWDGYDNAGIGSYVADTNKWTDLVHGGMDLTVGGGAAFSTADGDYSLRREATAPSDSRMAYGSAAVTTAKTIEIVIKRKARVTYAVVFSAQGHTEGLLAMKNDDIGCNASGYFRAKSACDGEFATITYVKDANNAYHVYTNGYESARTGTSEGWSGGMTSLVQIGGRATNGGNAFYGRVYAVRMYSSALPAEDILANHQLDVRRFVNGEIGSSASDRLVITGNPGEYGTPSPNYGTITGLAVGDNRECTMPASFITDNGEMKMTCVGCDLVSNKVVTTSWEFTDNNPRVVNYVHPNWTCDPKLVWRFGNIQYKVNVSADITGTTVSTDKEWAAPGETVTLTASYDSEHYELIGWNGAEGIASGKTLSFIMPSHAVNAVANLSGILYVSADGDDEHDGLTRETALATVGAATAKAQTDDVSAVILVGPGVYALPSQLSITNTKRVRIVAEEGPAVTAFKRTGRYNHMLSMNSADSSIEGFSFTQSSGNNGRGVIITAGTLSGCVVSNVYGEEIVRVGANAKFIDSLVCGNHQSGRSSVVQMFGGLADRCRIVRNISENEDYGEALEFWSGGTVRNSLIADNTNLCDHAAGVNTVSSDMRLENCTVVNNVSLGATAVAGLVGSGGSIVNCIITGNRNSGGIREAANRTYSYCASTAALSGEGNITVARMDFADEASGDYRVMSGPTVNVAILRTWMDGATDLDGNNRVIGSAPDMGCYELELGALRAVATVSSSHAVGTGDFTLTATATGADTEGLTYAWTVSRDGVTMATGNAAELQLTDLGVGAYDVALTVGNAHGETYVWPDGVALFTVHPQTIFVSTTSIPKYPYASWETAANTLADALEDIQTGMTVLIADGEYPITRTVGITERITVKSVNGPDRTTFRRTAANVLMLNMNNGNARFEGVTFAQDSGCNGKVFDISAGTLADCAVIGCKADDGSTACILTRITGGLITNTVWRGSAGLGNGAVLAAYGGKVIGCELTGNRSSHNLYGGAILASGGVTIRNCLVADNTNTLNAAGIVLYNGTTKIENCTIARNVATEAGAFAAGIERRLSDNNGAGVLVNCIVYGNTTGGTETNLSSRTLITSTFTLSDILYSGEGNKAADPLFRNASRGNYRLTGSSPAIDAGVLRDWMEGAFDLDGNDRILNDLVDMGCYEYHTTGLRLMLQ